MNARLVAISGPLEGASFPIGGELSIGRDRQNTLAIEDRVLSRRHCAIQETDGKCSLRDLGSSNGTYVNGLPVAARVLNDGDQITAGQSLFLFASNTAADAAGSVEMDHGGINPLSTVMLKPEDAIYLRPQEVPEIPGAAKNLRVLLAIGTVVSSIRGLEALERKLLEAIFDVIPAERGAILLPAPDQGEFDSVCYWSRVEENPAMRVSHTIVEKVMREGVAVLSNTVLEGTGVTLTESLAQAKVSALLAVPLHAFDKVLGVIYLDARDGVTRFEEDHLQLLTGIAGLAAPALETALLVERLEKENSKLKAEINIQHDMVGASPRIRQVFDFIAQAAPSSATIPVC